MKIPLALQHYKTMFSIMLVTLAITTKHVNAASIMQQDFVDQINAGNFMSIRDIPNNSLVPSYSTNDVISYTYDTLGTTSSPWFLTAVLKGAVVGLAGVDGGLIGDLHSKKWGDRGVSIGLGAGAAFVAAVNVCVPLSSCYVHDLELFSEINVSGYGDMIPDILATTSLNIIETLALPGISPNFALSLLDSSFIFGHMVDEIGNIINDIEITPLLLQDTSDNSAYFGVLASHDMDVTGMPISPEWKVKLELENVLPGVPDNTPIEVTSTLIVANAQIPEPSTYALFLCAVCAFMARKQLKQLKQN